MALCWWVFTKAEIFDVFLCHKSEDKHAVREIALELSKEGIRPWLDVDQISPGTSWQTALGEQIESINSAAVFVVDAGLGPWQNQESQALLNQFVKRGCPVIPVVLPSAKTAPDLPWMFANLHCVDFRTDSQPLQRLIWGITGQRPAVLADVPTSNKPATMQEATKPRLVTGSDEQATQDKFISEARLYPPLTERAKSTGFRCNQALCVTTDSLVGGYTPLNFVKFLDHCAKLILLKKVGGGYIFIHRMLLDYFADLSQSTKAEKGTKGSGGR